MALTTNCQVGQPWLILVTCRTNISSFSQQANLQMNSSRPIFKVYSSEEYLLKFENKRLATERNADASAESNNFDEIVNNIPKKAKLEEFKGYIARANIEKHFKNFEEDNIAAINCKKKEGAKRHKLTGLEKKAFDAYGEKYLGELRLELCKPKLPAGGENIYLKKKKRPRSDSESSRDEGRTINPSEGFGRNGRKLYMVKNGVNDTPLRKATRTNLPYSVQNLIENFGSAINAFHARALGNFVSHPDTMSVHAAHLNSANSFRVQRIHVETVTAILNKTQKWLGGKVDNAIIPCSGYGAAAIACGLQGAFSIVAVDPWREVLKGLEKEFENNTTLQKSKAGLLTVEMPIEEFIATDEYIKYHDSADFMYSCPPYFLVEKYSDDMSQSIKKFPKYADWKSGFLQPLIESYARGLKSDGKGIGWLIIPEMLRTSKADRRDVDFKAEVVQLLKINGLLLICSKKHSLAEIAIAFSKGSLPPNHQEPHLKNIESDSQPRRSRYKKLTSETGA